MKPGKGSHKTYVVAIHKDFATDVREIKGVIQQTLVGRIDYRQLARSQLAGAVRVSDKI